MRVECDDCGWTADIEESDESFGLHTVHHLYERLSPGCPTPAGECPECGAFSYPVDEEREATVQAILDMVEAVAEQGKGGQKTPEEAATKAKRDMTQWLHDAHDTEIGARVERIFKAALSLVPDRQVAALLRPLPFPRR